MLSDVSISRILTAALSHGGDFSEVYIERSKSSSISLLNGVVEGTSSNLISGIGIRILEGDIVFLIPFDEEVVYILDRGDRGFRCALAAFIIFLTGSCEKKSEHHGKCQSACEK